MKEIPAFPTDWTKDNTNGGMTLLDYFANEQARRTFGDDTYWDSISNNGKEFAEQEAANRAYNRAEAMLKEREKRIK